MKKSGCNSNPLDRKWYARVRALPFYVVLVGLSLAGSGQAAFVNGEPDYGFHNPLLVGRVTSPLTMVRAVLLSSTGDVWLGGTFLEVDQQMFDGLVRLSPRGVVNLPPNQIGSFPGYDQTTVNGLAQDSKGRIVVVGSTTSQVVGSPSFIAWRLLADGSLDPEFAPMVGDAVARACAVDRQGRTIVVGDFLECNGVKRLRIARLNVDGTLDLTFDPSLVTSPAGGRGVCVVVDDKDRIYAGGPFSGDGVVRGEGVVRILPDGTFDRSFLSPLSSGTEVKSIQPLKEGGLLIGGTLQQKFRPARYLLKLGANGLIDTNFAGVTAAFRSPVLAMAMDSQSRIWTVGASVVRLSPDARIDPTYKALSLPEARAVAVDSLGAAYVAGSIGASRGLSAYGLSKVFGNLTNPLPRATPPIVLDRTNTVAHVTQDFIVSATANGAAVHSWQWYRNGLPLFRETNATLVLPGLQLTDAACYQVVARFPEGEGHSVGVCLEVLEDAGLASALDTPGWIWATGAGTWRETFEDFVAGGSAAYGQSNRPFRESWIETRVYGPGRLYYSQAAWITQQSHISGVYLNDIDLGFTFSSFPWSAYSVAIPAGWNVFRWTFGYASLADPRPPEADDDAGFLDSVRFEPTKLRPPKIVVGPNPVVIEAGGSCRLYAVAEGTVPLAYQWMKDGVAIPGAEEQVLTFTWVSMDDAADYQVVITNAEGTALSSQVHLTVVPEKQFRITHLVIPAETDGSQVECELSVELGGDYEFQSCDDLVTWRPTYRVLAEESPLRVHLPRDVTLPRLFYRVIRR